MGEIELLPSLAGVRLKEAESDHRLLMLRERLPRSVPRGGWARFYAWPDGRVEEVRQADSDFTAWEKNQAIVPAPRP